MTDSIFEGNNVPTENDLDETFVYVMDMLQENDRSNPETPDLDEVIANEFSFLQKKTKPSESAVGEVLDSLQNKPRQKRIDDKQYQELQILEELLSLDSTTDERKTEIIRTFWKISAVPDRDALDYLMEKPNSARLKKAILTYFPKDVSVSVLIQMLQNKNLRYEEVKEAVIHFAGARSDIPVGVMEALIRDKQEKEHLRIRALDFFSIKISPEALVSLVTDRSESMTIRYSAIQSSALRFDFDISLIEECLLDELESLKIKKRIVKYFRDRLSITLLRTYFLKETIPIKEKVILIQGVYSRFFDMNKDGTIDILFMMMLEFKRARELFLKSRVLNPEFVQSVLVNPEMPEEIRQEMLEFCEDSITKSAYKEMVTSLVLDPSVNTEMRYQLIMQYSKTITSGTLIKLICESKNPVSFRRKIILNHKNKIRFSKQAPNLEQVLRNQVESFEFKFFILKHFYNYIHPESIFDLVAYELDDRENISVILRALKRVGFFEKNHFFLHRIVILAFRQKEVAKLLISIFCEELNAQELFQLLKHLSDDTSLVINVLKLLTDDDIRLYLIRQLFDEYKMNIELRTEISNQFYNYLPGTILVRLISDPDYPVSHKLELLKKEPKKLDMNQGGELDFLLLDDFEDEQLKQFIIDAYSPSISADVLKQVEQKGIG